MAVSDNDAQLVRQLLELLHANRAGWVAAEVEELREARAGVDPEADAEMLLVAIAQTIGLIPDLLLDARSRLTELSEAPEGVLIGGSDLSFDDTSALIELARSANRLREVVSDQLASSAYEAGAWDAGNDRFDVDDLVEPKGDDEDGD